MILSYFWLWLNKKTFPGIALFVLNHVSKAWSEFDLGLTLRFPITVLYTIHADDTTMGTFLHWINITSYIQGVITQFEMALGFQQPGDKEAIYTQDLSPGLRLNVSSCHFLTLAMSCN